MIDLSDGLALDLSRLCDASGTGVHVELARIPAHPAATPREALTGGEDYELLATLPSVEAVADARAQLADAFGVPLAEIGGIIEEGLVAADPDGGERPLDPEGWDHFR
jgi:thiamine-monophosphate kinase